MQYDAYLVVTLGAPRNHHALFIQHCPNEDGTIFQVTGNVQEGMAFETNTAARPEADAAFHHKIHLGRVSDESLPAIETVCRTYPPPRSSLTAQNDCTLTNLCTAARSGPGSL